MTFFLPLETPSHLSEGALSCVFFQKYVKYSQVTQTHPQTLSVVETGNVFPTPWCTLMSDFTVHLGSFQMDTHVDPLYHI